MWLFPLGVFRVRVQFGQSRVLRDSAVPSPLTISAHRDRGGSSATRVELRAVADGRRKDPSRPSFGILCLPAAATPWPAWRGIARPTCCVPNAVKWQTRLLAIDLDGAAFLVRRSLF